MTSEPNRGLFRSTASGIVWVYASTASLFLAQLAVLTVLARTLTPSDFGVMGFATIVFTFASLGAHLGIGQALVQRSTIDDAAIRVVFTASCVLGTLVGLAVFGLAPVLAVFFREPMAEPILRLISVSFPILGVGTAAEALLQREMRFRALGIAQVSAYMVGYGVVAIALSLMGFGVWSLAIAAVTQAAVRIVLAMAFRPHPVAPAWNTDILRGLMGYGGGLTVSKLLNTIAVEGDYVVVGRYLGPAALGIYNRSYQLMLIPVALVGEGIGRVLFPSLSRVQADPEKLREGYLTTSSGIAFLGLALAGGMIVLAPEIVATVLGAQWTEAVLPLQILSAVLFFRIAYKLDDAMAKATGRLYARAMRDFVYAATVVGGALVALPYGLPGVASAVGVAIAINFVLGVRLSLSITRTGVRAYVSALRPGLILGGATVGLATLARHVALSIAPASVFVLTFTAVATVAGVGAAIWVAPRSLGIRMRALLHDLLGLVPQRGLVRRARARVRTPGRPDGAPEGRDA